MNLYNEQASGLLSTFSCGDIQILSRASLNFVSNSDNKNIRMALFSTFSLIMRLHTFGSKPSHSFSIWSVADSQMQFGQPPPQQCKDVSDKSFANCASRWYGASDDLDANRTQYLGMVAKEYVPATDEHR
ncbi:hypothetical protein T12_9714 [Trichinella patagoniensis]|uniref:Uncharacterized protein n=1 Tax=Trichinella patagoniensis TaxID=990121 RepID=A0A0V0ZHH0_9BILA|nr:hypothetical protein T12_9714 [Trichinella patagoniensis]